MVHPPLHHRHGLPRQLTKDQLALVAGGGGVLKIGDVAIGHHDGLFHLVPQIAQAGAQDHGYLGLEALEFFPEIGRAGLVIGVGKVHR